MSSAFHRFWVRVTTESASCERGDAALGGRLLDLLAVLVRSGQEEDLAAGHPVVAGQGVGDDRRVGVADVGHVVDVVDRRRDVKRRLRLLFHRYSPPRMSVMASARVTGWVRKMPRTAEVTVIDLGFLAPRMDMHMCSASMTTMTPSGSRCSMIMSAICLVSRSWTWSRRDSPSTTRAILDRPTIRPSLGM